MAFLFLSPTLSFLFVGIFVTMVIYDTHNNKILDATLTEGAEHEQELGRSDLVRLSWQSDVKLTLPAGAYITPFDDGLKYRLLSPYTPTEDDKGFKYTPEFQHPLMWLSRVPFLYDTTDADKNPIKQQEWSFDGLTTNALEYACKAINEALNITTESEKFTFTLCGNVDSSVSFSVSSNDILSVLSSIAQGCKNNACEWHLSWKHKALYFGQISINLGEDVPTLKVHENIQKASVSDSKEPYYNCFYPQGSTKNMSTKALVGTGNVATLARLGLDKAVYPDGYIYVGTDGNVITKEAFEASGEIKQTLTLSFDDVYPHIDLYVYKVRQVVKKLKNSQTNKVELDSNGKEKTYTIWYISLAYPTTIKDNTKALVNTTNDKDEQGNVVTHYWYSYELDVKKQVLQGHTLKGFFKVNTHTTDGKYDALTQSLVGQPNGQDGFELRYHKDVSASSGEYEIVKYQSGDIIIPTNENEGLYPRGKDKPDYTCNIVVLFNIVMGENETKAAQEELAARTIKEINRRTQNNNNYSFQSNAVEFAKSNPNLYIGQKVIFNDGNGYELNTRILKLITKLDYPIIQEIVVGNQAVKGTISQLKEDVNNILSGNFSGGGGLNAAQATELIKNYTDIRFLSKLTPDTAQELITFLKGVAFNNGAAIDGEGNALLKAIQTLGFERTINGFGVWLDEKGRAHGQIDYLEVIGKAIFRSLQIDEYKHIGGNIVLSGANAVIEKVVPVSGGWKCYLHTDDGDKAITNDWEPGDQALCQTFNIKAGVYENVSNRYYWRCVSAVAQKSATEKAYIVITADDAYRDKSTENDAPMAGDNIVLCGHNSLWDVANGIDPTRNRNRMNVTMITTSKEEGGTIEVYRNIHDFSLSKGNAIFHLSSDKIYMNSQRFEWISADGERIPNVIYRGDWTVGTVAARYEAWYYGGGTWLSLEDNNTDEPTAQSPKWKKYASKGEDGTSPYTVQILSESGGNIIHNGQGQISLVATVLHGEQDITASLLPNQFSWVIQSGNTDFDTAWNARHEAIGNRTTISAEEVNLKAQIDCIVNIE